MQCSQMGRAYKEGLSVVTLQTGNGRCRLGSGHKAMRGGVGKLGMGRRCQANRHAAEMRLGEVALASAAPRERANADDVQRQAWEERTIS